MIISCYFCNHIFNINSLNSFHLPFPYKYQFVVNENEMVGALTILEQQDNKMEMVVVVVLTCCV